MMPNERARTARAELHAWYLRSLLPKLARAATTGAADPAALDALDAQVRELLDLSRSRKEAA